MFCTKCGNKVEESDAFCTACGEKVVNMQDDAGEDAQKAFEPQTAQSSTQPIVAQSEPQPATQTQATQPVQQTSVVQPVSQTTVPQPQPQSQPQPMQQPVQQVQQMPVQATTAFGMPVNASPIPTPAVASVANANASGREISMTKSKKKSGNTKIIIIILVIALIAAAAAAAVLTNGFGFMGPMVKGSVNEYTWDELSKISEQISAAPNEESAIEIAKRFNLTTPDGRLDGTQYKEIQLTDGKNVSVQITGFWHDEKSSGGKAGITFIFKDVMIKRPMNTTDTDEGGWDKSEMRHWLSNEGMNTLPEDLRERLISVNKLTNNTGHTDNTKSVTATQDKLWLYSAKEICGDITWWSGSDKSFCDDVCNAEGSQYKLFREMEIDANSSNRELINEFDGEFIFWWLRSPKPDSTYIFLEIGDNGNPHNYAGATYSSGVVPGFCI